MLWILLMVMYAWGVVAMETLHDALSVHTSASFPGCDPYCPSFESAQDATALLFHLLVGSDWWSVLVHHSPRFVNPLLMTDY